MALAQRGRALVGVVFDSLLEAYDGPRSCFSYPWCRVVTTYEYDWKGNLVKTTDPLGNATLVFYDSTGLATKLGPGMTSRARLPLPPRGRGEHRIPAPLLNPGG